VKHRPFPKDDWDRLLDRAELPWIVKSIGHLLARYADKDGSNVFPGLPTLADITGFSKRYISTQMAVLRDVGLIDEAEPGTSRSKGPDDGYQLTVPCDGHVPETNAPLALRLGPDGARLIPRKPVQKRRPKATDDIAAIDTASEQESDTELRNHGSAAQEPEFREADPAEPVDNRSGAELWFRRPGTMVPPGPVDNSERNHGSAGTEPWFLEGGTMVPQTNHDHPGPKPVYSPLVSTSLGAKIDERTNAGTETFPAAEPGRRTEPAEPTAEHAAALALLAGLPGSGDFVLRLAARQLRAHGTEPTPELVALLAADIATRPETRTA
jgi:hypothetical protein